MGEDNVIIHDKDGVPWHEARKPFWLHRCTAQTYGWNGPTYVERCPCGGIRLNRRIWLERNSRKGK